MKYAIAALTICLFANAARADGFAITDLTRVPERLRTLPGNDYTNRTDSGRMTLSCENCGGIVGIDFLLGRSTDGTEGRFRSGQTTIKHMEDLCRERDNSCRMEKITVGPGIGWQSIWSGGSTAILFRDGDMLTIRAVAGAPEEAQSYVRKAVQSVAPVIIGR